MCRCAAGQLADVHLTCIKTHTQLQGAASRNIVNMLCASASSSSFAIKHAHHSSSRMSCCSSIENRREQDCRLSVQGDAARTFSPKYPIFIPKLKWPISSRGGLAESNRPTDPSSDAHPSAVAVDRYTGRRSPGSAFGTFRNGVPGGAVRNVPVT